MFTNLPRDVITNTWHFDEEPLISLSQMAIAYTPLLHDFYTDAYALGGMANYVTLTDVYTKWYDLGQPEPRQPIRVQMASMASISAVSVLPTEVSCVLSFEASPSPGVPLARQRGRIYLGALGSNWMDPSTISTYPIFKPSLVAATATAAGAFKDAVDGAGFGSWVVLSTTANQTFVVNNGHVDNTPDTQRRRGVAATQRTNWA